MSFAKEGLPFIIPAWIIILLLWVISYFTGSRAASVAAIIFTLLGLFTTYFFRDPEREIPASEKAFVSPADGRIIDICEMDEPEFLKGKAIRVSIFLSVFNVHVNRIPAAGTVVYKKYHQGKFWGAFRDKASLENEQTCVGLTATDGTRITVKQIAGFIARRIVCYADSGKTFQKGERFGLIRFGSRTDLFLPAGTLLKVKKGDRVKGGTSIIGEKP
jgi:phosphatidylserine decarboxylase